MKYNWLIAQILLVMLIMLSCIAVTRYLSCVKCSYVDSASNLHSTHNTNALGMDKFASRLANLEQEVTELKSLISQVDKPDKNISIGKPQASLLVQVQNLQLAVAVLQLGIAIRTYKPFDREFNLVRQLSMEMPQLRVPLDNLVHYAATGVATVAELRDSFGVLLLPKLYTIADTEDASWSSQIWAWGWAALIPWQTASSQIPINLTRALIKSAMDRLSEDDLKGALDLVVRLNGPAATVTARWLKEANNRLAVDVAMDTISNLCMTLLNRS